MWVSEGVSFEALAYILYTRERYEFFSIVYIKNTIKFSEVKVDVQNGGSRFEILFLFILFLQ